MKKYQSLLKGSDSSGFSSAAVDKIYLKKVEQIIVDKSYIDFLSNYSNGGFFYSRSLQIYSLSGANAFNDVIALNNLLQTQYTQILESEFFFGQDVFGNQFGFSSKGVFIFNIETGEKNSISNDFDSWIDELMSDLDYYTGESFSKAWAEQFKIIDHSERLCPTIPFVMGGEYEINNLYNSAFPNYILNNANIANQIYNLPDGTPVKIIGTD